MCSGLRRPSTGPGPTVTGRCRTRWSNTRRTSPRPGIRTALVCRSGRATGRRQKPLLSLETGQVRCRCWTPNEKLCSTLIWRPVCRTDIRRRRARAGHAETDIFAISPALVRLSTFQQASMTGRIAEAGMTPSARSANLASSCLSALIISGPKSRALSECATSQVRRGGKVHS
jgi:hypothetical protein